MDVNTSSAKIYIIKNKSLGLMLEVSVLRDSITNPTVLSIFLCVSFSHVHLLNMLISAFAVFSEFGFAG